MFRYFRKGVDKQVTAYCDACYETGKHEVQFSKNHVTLDCVSCNNQRYYQRNHNAPINFTPWGQETQNDDYGLDY
jgi:RNase P subunit RPR2